MARNVLLLNQLTHARTHTHTHSLSLSQNIRVGHMITSTTPPPPHTHTPPSLPPSPPPPPPLVAPVLNASHLATMLVHFGWFWCPDTPNTNPSRLLLSQALRHFLNRVDTLGRTGDIAILSLACTALSPPPDQADRRGTSRSCISGSNSAIATI